MHTRGTSNGQKFGKVDSFYNYWMGDLTNYANCYHCHVFISLKIIKIFTDINFELTMPYMKYDACKIFISSDHVYNVFKILFQIFSLPLKRKVPRNCELPREEWISMDLEMVSNTLASSSCAMLLVKAMTFD